MTTENASLIALSRQMTLRLQMDVIANNIANANTPAFKSEALLFATYLHRSLKGMELSFVHEAGLFRDTSEGSFTGTDNDFDVAIHGDGYFVVETPTATRYTRNGSFTLDASGKIVTHGGYAVLGDNNRPIFIPEDATKVEIAEDGTISVERLGTDRGPLNEEGLIGKLQIVRFENQQELRKLGNGLYGTEQVPERVTDVREASIRQGMIEESNVQPILEMTKMIHTHRAYQSAQRLLNSEHQMEMAAIDKLTRAA